MESAASQEGGPEQENYSSILRMLVDVLLSHETSEAEKKRIMRDDYEIPMTEAIERRCQLCAI